MDDKDLLEAAIAVRKYAYCPYSHFPVGAALLCDDGTVYCGVNVENAVNGLSLCAEQVALFTAISAGKHKFVKMAVVCASDYCRPCGACRQVLYEHAPELVIIMGSPTGKLIKRSIRDLLPDSFSLPRAMTTDNI